MEATSSSGISVDFYQTTLCYNRNGLLTVVTVVRAWVLSNKFANYVSNSYLLLSTVTSDTNIVSGPHMVSFHGEAGHVAFFNRSKNNFTRIRKWDGARGSVVVEVQCYKPQGRGLSLAPYHFTRRHVI
jgi:hypothetical protein